MFEARTRLSTPLDEVARGVAVVITGRGVAIARPVPAGVPRRTGDGDPIARARTFAKGQTPGRLSWKKLRDEGRR